MSVSMNERYFSGNKQRGPEHLTDAEFYTMTLEKFEDLDMIRRTDLYRRNPELYKKLAAAEHKKALEKGSYRG